MTDRYIQWIPAFVAVLLLFAGYWIIYFQRRLKSNKRECEERIRLFEIIAGERTKNLESIRDSLSEYAVQKFELAQELEEKNKEINRQKDDLLKQSESLKNAYEEIKKLDNFRQKMVRMIIHDLKNPLNVIINIAGKPDAKSEGTEIIKKLSWDMLELILNILEVNKLESSKMKISMSTFDLSLILRNQYEKFSFTLTSSKVELKTNLPDPCLLYADKKLTERIFDNLISNALKFTPSGGFISVSAGEEGNLIRIEINDSGVGIPQNILKEVFDEFVHGETITGDYSNSTGIGLAFCKLAVEEQGGKIGISSSPGNGTTVWFTLVKGELSDNKEVIEQENFLAINYSPGSFNNDDIQLLRPYLNELKLTGIYELSSILRILGNDVFKSNERLQKWSLEIEKAAYKADEESFYKLLEIDNTG
jgi:signal transduction histidine kinase